VVMSVTAYMASLCSIVAIWFGMGYYG